MAAAVAAAVLVFWLWRSYTGGARPGIADPALLEQQASERPDDLGAQLRWGEWLMKANRIEMAVPVLEHARQIAPGDARPYAWLGVAASSARRSDDARALLADALRRDPSNITAIRALANQDAQLHHLRPAIAGFERLTQLQPNDADAWQRLGLLLMGAGQNYRSLDALTRAAALDPTDTMTQGALGNMALQAGRLDQADRAYLTVLAHEPRNPQALTGLARTMMRMNPSPEGLVAAEQQADIAVQAMPSVESYKARGQIRMTRGRIREAIEDFEACVRLEPRAREPYVLLSQCYAVAGRPDLARKASEAFERLRAAQLARDRAAGRSIEPAK